LSKVKYPAEKNEIVIVNDASTDNTLTEINQFTTRNSLLKISVFDSKERLGKTDCLNQALKAVNADVVIVSDADCFWSSDILMKALPYLSDPNVGAITGRELLLNPKVTWVTSGEQFYDSTVQAIRIGESKIHSTIIFQGGFAAYKYSLLHEFDHEADDSGTALNIVQRNSRALLIPELGFYTMFPSIWRHKMTLKSRRASQLQHLWIKCLKLLLRGKLVLPKRIAIPEIFLHIFNPITFFALILATALLLIEQPFLLLVFALILLPFLLVRKSRISLIEIVQNNLILLTAMTSFITKRKFKVWKTVENSRLLLNEKVLQEKHLV